MRLPPPPPGAALPHPLAPLPNPQPPRRYFTVPFVLVLLHVPPPALWRLRLTAAAYLLVDLAALHLFTMRPFTWPDGSVARFMW